MRKFGVIPFRFNKPTAEKIEPGLLSMYTTLAMACEGGQLVQQVQRHGLTIPLTYEMSSDSALAYSITEQSVSEWIGDVDFLIIDLANPPEQPLANHHVFQCVARIVNNTQQNSERRCRILILLPVIIPELDSSLIPIKSFIADGRLALISDDGAQICDPKFGILIGKPEHVAAVRLARGSPEQIAQKKLLRFPGHFKRSLDGKHSHCVAHFFDGQLCQAEFVELLDGYISSWAADKTTYQVLYHCTVSSWLERVALAVAERRQIETRNFETVLQGKHIELRKDVLVVVPMVDTQATARRLYEEIRRRNPSSNVTFLAMLTTVKVQSEPRSFYLSDVAGEVKVDFFLHVNQERYELDHCPLCATDTPATDPNDPDPYDTMGTLAFWGVCRRLGFVPEPHVPRYRESIGHVPQFKNLEDEDGAYLAYKIHKLLRSTETRLPAAPVVLCPSEEGARRIGSWLEFAYGMTIIAIPKGTSAQNFNSDHALSELPISRREEWETKLRSLLYLQHETARREVTYFSPKKMSVVVFDELSVLGNAQDELIKFAQAVGFEVLCCVSVLNIKSDQVRKANACPAFSLYEIDARL